MHYVHDQQEDTLINDSFDIEGFLLDKREERMWPPECGDERGGGGSN